MIEVMKGAVDGNRLITPEKMLADAAAGARPYSSTVIIPVTPDTLPALRRTMADLYPDDFDRAVIVWGSPFAPTREQIDETLTALVPFSIVTCPSVHVTEQIQVGAASVEAVWYTVLFPGERIPTPTHPTRKAIQDGNVALYMPASILEAAKQEGAPGLLASLERLPAGFFAASMPVAWVDNNDGLNPRTMTMSCRTLHRSANGAAWNNGFVSGDGSEIRPMVYLQQLPILKQTVAAFCLENGDSQRALDLAAKSSNAMDRRTFIRARTAKETRGALEALQVLYTHYSLYEDLHNLEILMRHLPYTLEGLPEVELLHKLLHQQIGHLDDEAAWYETNPYTSVATVETSKNAGSSATPRLVWLAQECKRLNFKRVVELGAIDGVSLFPLMQLVPEIEWHGVDISPNAVKHGYEVARGIAAVVPTFDISKFHLHCGHFWDFAGEHVDQFDAAALFEILEHNRSPYDLLRYAECCVRPRGRVFISTPNGAWSPYDDKTRSIPLRKDHIRAYTPQRMAEVLKDKKDVQIQVVENPSYWECNSWVFASYEVTR